MTSPSSQPILPSLEGPAELRRLAPAQLQQLAGEIRQFILETVGKTGGHLAANLGTVELTIALLRVFDPPRDRILWDVGHQTYAWKILTGRRDRFPTLRQTGGLSGFPHPVESPFDAFVAGHAGTALSAALGFAVARDRSGGNEHVIAVVGDGALGNGLSFEALNNLRTAKRLIVILNDNEMSIAANVGSLSKTLGALLANPRYNRWKGNIEGLVTRVVKGERPRSLYYRIEETIKGFFLQSRFFEEFGLRYIGPVDGHDLGLLEDALRIAREYPRPILLHIVTRKGRGYPPAEADPERWHSTAPFSACDETTSPAPAGLCWADAMGQHLIQLAERDPRIVAITAAMPGGTGLSAFARRFPDRFFDVGICESHAVVFAAALAAAGLRPFLPLYSTFAQRAVDPIIHDVCLQNLPVVLLLDRAGVVGEDGPTHQGVFDIPLLSPIPNLTFAQPADVAELAALMDMALQTKGPFAIRYPRGMVPEPAMGSLAPLTLGRAVEVAPGDPALHFWALGDLVPLALAAAETVAERLGRRPTVTNARFIKPLDADRLRQQVPQARLFAFFENGAGTGGFGMQASAVLWEAGYRGAILRFGWPDRFIEQGRPADLFFRYGLTAEAIARAVLEQWESSERPPT